MPENISGVPAGRSVFHLTSPFIGLLDNQYGLNVRIADHPLRTGLRSQKLAPVQAPGQVLRLLFAELLPK